MALTTVCIDTNVVVALADTHDKWHSRSVTLRDALLAVQAPLVYFDCVMKRSDQHDRPPRRRTKSL